MVTDLDWVVPGAKAVVLSDHRVHPSITEVTIERVLKRDVVLDTGDRFTKPSLRRSLGDWAGNEYLVRPDDERIAPMRARIAEQHLVHRLRNIADKINVAVNQRNAGWREEVRMLLDQGPRALAQEAMDRG